VLEARNGRQALALLEREPACILLDVMMPDMNGFEVCRRVKSNPASAHIPVILVTALVDEEQRQYGFAAVADDFVSKPIDARRLLTAIQQALSHNGKTLPPNWKLIGENMHDAGPVLIVDGDECSGRSLKLILSETGYQAEMASSLEKV
jgi:two-component system cell cycle response regulator